MLALKRSALVLALSILTTACLGDDPVATEPADPADIDFAPALGIDLSAMTLTSTGLYYRDDAVGTGPVAAVGDSVHIEFAGFLSSGQQFDGTNPGAVFRVRLENLIPGFIEGTVGMQAGGERTLVIPPLLAYGTGPVRNERGVIIIPGNSVLVFNITLLSIEEDDTGVQ